MANFNPSEMNLIAAIEEDFKVRSLVWPDNGDQAIAFAWTEMAEVQELLLSRMKQWTRNNPEKEEKRKFTKEKFRDECGDVIRMCILACLVEGVGFPLEGIMDKIERKQAE